jgi:nascent polypeptide-associated complex subunit alpha
MPMMQGINPQMMKRLMKQLKTEEIEADEVIIKAGNRKIVIKNPQVMKMNVSGQDTFQVMGEISEEEDINPDDIKMIVENTGCTEKEAVDALAETKGDIAEAIMKIKKE